MQIHLRMLAIVTDLGFCQVLHVCAWYKSSDGVKGLHIYSFYISMECLYILIQSMTSVKKQLKL